MAIEARKAECSECGALFVRRKPWFRYCSTSCAENRKKRLTKEHRKSASYKKAKRVYRSLRRARERNTAIDRIDPIDVFIRDSWRCYLCGEKTDKNLRGAYEDLAPELDHINPLSKGGTHTLNNVACSCRKCNLSKSDKQLCELTKNQ